MFFPHKKNIKVLEKLTGQCVKWACGQWAMEVVILSLALWLFSGVFMKFSESWQMIIGTSSATITIFMVFLLARTQTKDILAIHMKLNEVIGALKGANNQLISIENLSETSIQELSKRYETVAAKLSNDDTVSMGSIIFHEIVADEENKELVIKIECS